MTASRFRIDPLLFDAKNGRHDRSVFRCGDEVLDRYLQSEARQDTRRKVANCFVAVEIASGQIAAFYTMSAASVAFVDLPPEEAERLPRYPTLPAIWIRRMAVDEQFKGLGLRPALLMDAARRAAQSDSSALILLVDAKNDKAVALYERYGFRALRSRPRMLFLPLATARKAFVEELDDEAGREHV